MKPPEALGQQLFDFSVLCMLLATRCAANMFVDDFAVAARVKLPGATKAAGLRDMETGTVVNLVLQASAREFPAPLTAGGWVMTLYAIPGMQFVSAKYLRRNAESGKVSIESPGAVGSVWSGCGPLKCPADGSPVGGVADSLLETGIFMSTDPRTRLVPDGLLSKRGLVYNAWDRDQIEAFDTGDHGTLPVSVGSPVSGPDVLCSHDYNSNDPSEPMGKTGPWKRVRHPGSLKQVRDQASAVSEQGSKIRGTDHTIVTSAGIAMSDKSPLPASVNALRLVGGEWAGAEQLFVVVDLVVTNVTLATASPALIPDAPVASLNVMGVYGEGNAMTSHFWKQYNASHAPHSLLLPELKPTPWSLTVLPIDMKCAGTSTGTVYFATTGGVVPFHYSYSDGLNLAYSVDRVKRKSMAEGNYSVTVTDASGYQVTKEFSIGAESRPINIRLVARGNGKGRMSTRVWIDGGRPPYSCYWTAAATNKCNLTKVEPKPDVLTVTDSSDCKARADLVTAFDRPLTLKGKVTYLEPCGASIDVSATGGVAPYTYHWSHGMGNVSHIDCDPGTYRAMVTDMFGFADEQSFVVYDTAKCPESDGIVIEREDSCANSTLVVKLELLNHQLCHGEANGRVFLQIDGGIPPYDYIVYNAQQSAQNQSIFVANAGQVWADVTDASGCKRHSETLTVQDAKPFVATVFVEDVGETLSTWIHHNLRVTWENGIPPYLPMWDHLRHVGSPLLRLAPPGRYSLSLTDHNECVSNAVIEVPDLNPNACPELAECAAKRDFHHKFYIQCLTRIALPLLWNTSDWNLCAARAAYEIVRKIHVPFDMEGITERDNGAMAIALILAEAVRKCEKKHGVNKCDFPLSLLGRFFGDHPEARNYFRRSSFGLCWLSLLEFPESRGLLSALADVLFVAPYGYDNDPVFAPSFGYPGGLRVATVVLKHVVFPSSLVKVGVFPWSLQIDVDLAALFVQRVMKLVRPKYVFPSDNAGILVLSKLATHVQQSAPDLVACFQRSMQWPAQYPPPVLSKLIKGHERFAPDEIVVAETDGATEISLDWSRVRDAWQKLNGSAYLKREYSEAARGVIYAGRESDVPRVSSLLLPRQEGIGVMDWTLRVRLFMQKTIDSKSEPVGVRLFAHHGRVLAMALSRLIGHWEGRLAIHYETIRNATLERDAVEFVRAINYTGFGSAWFWTDNERWYLIDFNARIERHACLSPVLGGLGEENDPCVVFQEFAGDRKRQLHADPPLVVRPGVEYIDAIRLASAKTTRHWKHFLANHAMWNVQRNDAKMYERAKQIVLPQASIRVVQNVSVDAWDGGLIAVELAPEVQIVSASWGSIDRLETSGYVRGLTAGVYSIEIENVRQARDTISIRVGVDASLEAHCPSFRWCEETLNQMQRVRCLMYLADTMTLGEPCKWDACQARALLLLAHDRHVMEAPGRVLASLAVVDSLSRCSDRAGDATPWWILARNALVQGSSDEALFEQWWMEFEASSFSDLAKFKARILSWLTNAHAGAKIGILGVGYDASAWDRNALSHVSQSGDSSLVYSLSSSHIAVPSAFVRHLRFPRDIAAHLTSSTWFLRYVWLEYQPSEVVATDRSGHFLMSRTGILVPGSCPILPCVHPAPYLSAFNTFSGAHQRVLSELGAWNVDLNGFKAKQHWLDLGRYGISVRREMDGYEKRIFLSPGRFQHAKIRQLLSRSHDGPSSMDMSLPYKVLMERTVMSAGPRVHVYVFAWQGRIQGLHVLSPHPSHRGVYETVRNVDAELQTLLLVQYFNYTGMASTISEGGQMIDFRPFVTKFQCLGIRGDGCARGNGTYPVHSWPAEPVRPGILVAAPSHHKVQAAELGKKIITPVRRNDRPARKFLQLLQKRRRDNN